MLNYVNIGKIQIQMQLCVCQHREYAPRLMKLYYDDMSYVMYVCNLIRDTQLQCT